MNNSANAAARGSVFGPLCPHCRKDAPLVYRGVVPMCSACGRPRVPLTAAAVNLAGQPSKVGGSVANVFGWVILGTGLLVAILVAALFQAIFPAGFFGWALGAVIAFVSVAFGLMLVYGGKSLRRSGVVKERETFERALFALAQNRGGILSALDVGQALAMPAARADALLTELAKADPERVRLEVDDAGAITYVFPALLAPASYVPSAQVRVASHLPADPIADDAEEAGKREAARGHARRP